MTVNRAGLSTGDKQIRNGPMQTHNLKLPKNYRGYGQQFHYQGGNRPDRHLIISVSPCFFSLKETQNSRNALQVPPRDSKTLALVQDSLGQDGYAEGLRSSSMRGADTLAPSPAPEAPPANRLLPPPQPPPTSKAAAEPKAQPGKPPAAEQRQAPARVAKAEPQAPIVPVKLRPKPPAAAVKTAALSYRPAKRRRRLSGQWPESMRSSARRKASSSICSNSR